MARKKSSAHQPSSANGTDSLYLGNLKFDPATLKSPIKILLDNTRLLFLLILVVLSAGITSFITLPRELNPEVEIPIVSVVTTLPGADPLDVEELVTKKLETEIENISTINVLNSLSAESLSNISIEFNSNVDPDEALDDVKEKVDLVTDLPEDASTPRVNKLDFNDQPVWQVALVGELDPRSLSRVAQLMQDELENASGIRKVDLFGDEAEEIVVSLKPTALLEYDLSADQVTSAIANSDIAVPAGAITINQTKYQVSVDNEVATIDQLRNLQIAVGGQNIQLGELTEIYFQSEDNDVFTTYVNGQEQVFKNAVQLDVFKSDNATIYDAVATAQRVLTEELQAYPQVEQVTIIDFSEEVRDSFVELGENFQTTIFLVFLTLFLFIGFRQAAIASLSIPLTFLSAFTIMSLTGTTLNFLSLFSLLLALGLVVDDAIVIVQAMHRYSQRFEPKKAGLMVFRDFVVPIWTTTLTTVWAFVPLLLATGIIGEFIKSIPLVVTATLLSSTTIAVLINLPLTVLFAQLEIPKRVQLLLGLLVFGGSVYALSLIGANSPYTGLLIASWTALAALLYLSRRQVLAVSKKAANSTVGQVVSAQPFLKRSWTWLRRQDVINTGLIDFGPAITAYRKLLYSIVTSKAARFSVYGLSALFFITSILFLAAGLLKTEFFPSTDQENIYVNVEGPAGWPVEQTQETTRMVEQRILQLPAIDHIVTQTGSLAPVDIGSSTGGSHLAYLTITLPPEEDRDLTSIELAERIRTEFQNETQARITVFEVSGGPPAGADLQINIKGAELETLEKISDQFMAVLEEMDGAININTSLKQSAGQISVQLNEQELARRGLSAGQVGTWLRTAVTGSDTSELTILDEEVDVVVRLNEENQTLSTLQNLRLPLFDQAGGPTQGYTLAEVASFNLETSPTTIEREGGNRVVRVTAAANNISATELLTEFEEQVAAAGIELPPGYTWDVGGVNEENEKSVQSIIQAMGISALLILITMVLQLNSFRKSLLVLSVIPLAVAGVFFNFTLAGIPLSFPALIGVLALFGIVVNNSIMLVEKINQNLNFGLDFIDAVVDACASRIEAIFFTSLTTTIGLLPITISDPLWRGLGGAIIAGLTVSGTLILIVLPSLFVEVFGGKEQKKSS